MIKILVVGDSITFGAGLELEVDDPKLWVNQLLKQSFSNYTLTNLAKIGQNNHWIFTETACALSQNNFDIVIVGWSELARYNFNVGLELYSTHTMLKNVDVNINPGQKISGAWLEETGNRLRRIHNDHWSILDLIKYVNILYNIQTVCKNKKIFFVNTLANWSTDYFVHKDFSKPGQLSDYLQQILQVETRDDNEIKKLYNLIHQQYLYYGSIKDHCWLNLYQSLRSLQIDSASTTDSHPGYLSQDVFVKKLLLELNERM